ncbi:MAG: sel1 repeat family protein, partial [Gammaproteobacteria bacterium]|nr:sel1 repeat family protein [Gammaproteobacteria bacterium]
MGRKKVPSAEVYKADEARRSNLDKSEKRDQQNKKELVTKEQAIAAFNQCRLKAEQGDKRAQYHLATMYRNGHGTEQNSQQAVFWYKEAAADSGGKRGNRDAQYQLGIIYLTGWCLTTESPQAGLDLLLQAANQNHAGAQHYLAVIYDPFRVSAYASKIEITKNLEKAVEWLIKAADNGDRAAQFDLGKKYEEGCGVEKSEEKAMEWLAKVAENYPEAQFYLGVKYQEGRGVKKNEAKAFELLNHAANKGHKEALAYLQALTKVIHPHNVYPEVRQLIDATHNVLGENCKVDASKMFYGLWHEGIPPLKDETFYYYTYQFCSSPQDIPKIMKQDTVYLYIEAEKLHYQVMKRGSNDLLDKFHFSKVPPKDGAVMQIYYVHNKTDLAYDCTIADHKGSIYKISIPAQSEDDEQRIQNKIKEKLKEKMVETHEGALYVYSDFVTSAEKESLNKKEKREKRIERKRELSKLKEIVFVNKRLTAEDDIRQISYQCNSKGTKCIYTIVTDDGSLEVDKIAITPQDEPEEIEKKILMDCAHPDKKYGLPKEDHFISLKRKLDEEFGKNGCFEPSYEVRKGMSAPYEEILAYEKNFLRFVSTLIDVLNHGDFKEIFKEDENFEGLRARMVSIAAELKKNQETICKVLAQTAHNSSQMIDNLRDAYSQKNINLENYYEMVGLVQNLHY